MESQDYDGRAMLAFLLSIWLCVSLAAHACRRFSGALRSRDGWGLVPVWRYFVLNSMRAEFLLRRRKVYESSVDGALDDRFRQHRSPFPWLWNPERLDSKAAIDVFTLALEFDDAAARRVLRGFLEGRDAGLPEDSWRIIRRNNLDHTEETLELPRS